VIGYGTNDNGEKYWELQNTYSDDWGLGGKIKLARGVSWEKYGGQNGLLSKPAWVPPMMHINKKCELSEDSQ